jgi:adenosylcobinamide kinase/adenosylcobinamide-phosphate guanylyltransferase
LVYITGPVRSGKSRRAVDLARAWGDDVVYVATYRADPVDGEMEERVRKHRAERPAWRTLEAPADIAAALAALTPPPAGVVIDGLTLWASDRFEPNDADLFAAWDAQLACFRTAPWPVVVVGDEIGWTPVPPDPALRRFRDVLGLLGQRTAAAAHEAWLMVAGCPVRLK